MSRRKLARSGTGLPWLALAVAVTLSVAIAGCGSQASTGAGMPPPPEVSVANVLSKQVRQWDDFTGRVAAVETVELRPRVSGYVQRVAYEEGQEVNKGDLLFVIDPRPYQAPRSTAPRPNSSVRAAKRGWRKRRTCVRRP